MTSTADRMARERRARCPRLERGTWHTTSELAGRLGIERTALSDAAEHLTTRRPGSGATSPRYYQADDVLAAWCRRRFINVQIGDAAPTLAAWHGRRAD